MKKSKKLRSMLMAAAMVLSLVPMTAFAADTIEAQGGSSGNELTGESGYQYVASVTTAGDNPVVTYHDTIVGALEAAETLENCTVTVLTDADVDDGVAGSAGYIFSGRFTIDLNGKTLINSGDSGVITICNEGTDITITDTSIGKTGKIDGGKSEGSSTHALTVYDNASLTIDGGTFIGSDGVRVGAGGQDHPASLIVNGGTFQGSYCGLYVETAMGNTTINGGSFSGKSAAIETDGNFKVNGTPELDSADVAILSYGVYTGDGEIITGILDLRDCEDCTGWIIENGNDADLKVGEGLLLPEGYVAYAEGSIEWLEAIAYGERAVITDHVHSDAAADGDHLCDIEGCNALASSHTYGEDDLCTECGQPHAMELTYADGTIIHTDDVTILYEDTDDGSESDVTGIRLLRDLEVEEGLAVFSLTLDLNGFDLTGEMYGVVTEGGNLTITGNGTIAGGMAAVGAGGNLTIIGSPTLVVTDTEMFEELGMEPPSIMYVMGTIDLTRCTGYDGWTIFNVNPQEDMSVSAVLLPVRGSLLDAEGNTLTGEDVVALGAVVTLKEADCDGINNCPGAAYTDLKTDAWYHKYTDFVIMKGYMSGYSDSLFGPNDTVSRAQLVQILYRLEGCPAVSGEDSYPDTKADAWYAKAVLWATRNSIVSGYGNGKFGPDDPVTREQMATILYGYSKMKGYDLTEGSYSHFTDAAKVSNYAQTPMNWAVGNGLLSGMGDGTLRPISNSTRAEVATILKGYVENIVK